tara:strand:+ start:2113 stop:2454 length:342 start_codon:yes stop_codon:yes gene_type:complete
LEVRVAGQNVRTVNDLNFDDEVLQSDVPVLVDFTAAWCGPCKQIAPFVDQLADEFQGQIKVAKVDVDESPGTAAKCGVRAMPTLKVFKGGEVVAEHVGAIPKAKIAELIGRAL